MQETRRRRKMGDRVILRLEDIVKTFPGVKALDGVKLDVKEREVHSH